MDRCKNCKKSPVYKMDNRLKYPHIVEHKEPTCPFRFITQQASKNEAIKSWNEYIRKAKY